MIRLLTIDGDVYKTLCGYAQHYGFFPGNDRLAADMGWKSSSSAIASLRRLEQAGYIAIAPGREIQSILLRPSNLKLSPRMNGRALKKSQSLWSGPYV